MVLVPPPETAKGIAMDPRVVLTPFSDGDRVVEDELVSGEEKSDREDELREFMSSLIKLVIRNSL